MIGKIHNAKKCTVDGRDLFIASICRDDGRFIVSMRNVSEHDTITQARMWLEREALRRDEPMKIVVEGEP